MLKISLLLVLILNFTSMQCGITKKSEPPIEINATQLISDYEKDDISSNEKYQGQPVILSGKVSHFAVLRGITGVYFKSTNTDSKQMIICLINMKDYPDDYSKVAKMSGTEGKFAGIIDEGNKSNVIIKDCHHVE